MQFEEGFASTSPGNQARDLQARHQGTRPGICQHVTREPGQGFASTSPGNQARDLQARHQGTRPGFASTSPGNQPGLQARHQGTRQGFASTSPGEPGQRFASTSPGNQARDLQARHQEPGQGFASTSPGNQARDLQARHQGTTSLPSPQEHILTVACRVDARVAVYETCFVGTLSEDAREVGGCVLIASPFVLGGHFVSS